jgi:hypothetical protein
MYAYDDYGRPIAPTIYIDGQDYTSGEHSWFLSEGYHTVNVSVPSGNTFFRYISNNFYYYNNPVANYTNPVTLYVQNVMTLTAYYNTSNPPQPIGYDYGYGRGSAMFSTDWIMPSEDLALASEAFSQIYDLFENQSATYGHVKNYKSQTTLPAVTSQIDDLQSHSWSTFFYYGHMDERNMTSNPTLKSYGFRVQANPADQNLQETIWDTDPVTDNIWNHTAGENLHFVFLWVCNNANPPTGNSTPSVHGPPYIWTRQPDLSTDAYHYPDSTGYSFFGFEKASVTLMEQMNSNNRYKNWLLFFYYYALTQGDNLRDALTHASQAVNFQDGWDDESNPLYVGDEYIWWGGAGKPYGTGLGKMHVYGDGYVYLR